MEYQNLYQDGMSPPAPPPPATKPGGRAWRVAACAAAAMVLLGGGTSIGIAMTGGAAAAAASSQHRAAGPCQRRAAAALRAGHVVRAARIEGRCRRGLLRILAAGGIHGTITYRTRKGTRTLAFERGAVTSVAGSAVTVRATDGTTWTWDIVGSTEIREDGHRVATDKLAGSDQVVVAGPVVAGTRDARLIRILVVG